IDIPDHKRPGGKIIGSLSTYLSVCRGAVVVFTADFRGKRRRPFYKAHQVSWQWALIEGGIGREGFPAGWQLADRLTHVVGKRPAALCPRHIGPKANVDVRSHLVGSDAGSHVMHDPSAD